MADLDYTVAVNTSAAERNLANLQKSVSGMNDSFIRLKSTLATFSLGAVISQAIKFADSVQDLADATDLSTASIIGFGAAVAQNGGSVDGAQKGIAKLVAEIDDAANSAGASREAFRDVGVSLNDLRTKSTQDIFKQVITGLAGIDDSATKSRLAATLLNKEMKDVNFKGVGGDFGASTANAEKYTSATQAAAAANDKLAAAVATFQLKLVAALEPINKFIASIDPVAIEVFIDKLITLAAALGGLYVISKVTLYIQELAIAFNLAKLAGFGFTAAMSAGMTVAGGGFVQGIKLITSAFAASTLVTTTAGASLMTFGARVAMFAGGLLRLIPYIGIAVIAFQALDAIVQSMTGKDVWEWAQKAAKGIGLIKQTSGEKAAADDKAAADHIANLKEIEAENQAVKDKIVRGQEAMAKLKSEIGKANLESKQSLQIQGQSLSNMGFRLAFERSLIGLSEDEKELQTQSYNLDAQRFDKQDEYARAVKKLQQEKSNTKDEDANKLLGARIGILQAEAAESDAQAKRHKEGILDQLKDLQKVRNEERLRIEYGNILTENAKQYVAELTNSREVLNGIQSDIGQKKTEVKFEGTQIGKGSFQKQMDQIKEDSRKGAEAAGKTFIDSFANYDGSIEQYTRLRAGLDEIAQGWKDISDAQIKNLEDSRTWSTGWKEAFNTYKENAYNTAAQAKGYFDTFSRGFEDTFVNMVKTGDISFKALTSGFRDVANSMIADFIRIQAQKALLALIPGGSILGSLFGAANGGPVQDNVPIMVGERGPELFIPKGAGSIVPNGAMNAAASSGQAMQTIVNYNIQAVDASSFRSLVARDPSFIYAVTEQGRRSQPTRRLG